MATVVNSSLTGSHESARKSVPLFVPQTAVPGRYQSLARVP